MKSSSFWSKYLNYDVINPLYENLGSTKIFAMGLMPVRGPKGFRKLDYEFAETIL